MHRHCGFYKLGSKPFGQKLLYNKRTCSPREISAYSYKYDSKNKEELTMNTTLIKISESTWSIPIAALLLVAMFAAFYTVVSDATKAGEQRRQATATQTSANMECEHSLHHRNGACAGLSFTPPSPQRGMS